MYYFYTFIHTCIFISITVIYIYSLFYLFIFFFFFFNDTATTEIYTLSLHERSSDLSVNPNLIASTHATRNVRSWPRRDRKSTRLNSSHLVISYAVFCLKKKKKKREKILRVIKENNATYKR